MALYMSKASRGQYFLRNGGTLNGGMLNETL